MKCKSIRPHKITHANTRTNKKRVRVLRERSLNKMVEMKKNKKGEKSDRILLKAIIENPGFSQYELKKKLKWHSGHVDSAVRRLLRSKKILLEVIERNGRRANLVYPIDYAKPLNVVEIPVKALNVRNPSWSQEACIYALDSSTIGISGRRIEEWDQVAGFKSHISPRVEEQKVFLEIPEDFVKFYNLDRKVYSTGIVGSNILITVSGEIIKTKRYPS